MNARLTPTIAFLLTMPPLLWAGNAVVGRALVGSVAPLTLNAMRWALAFVLLLPLGWRLFRRPQDILARWKYLSMLGLVGVGSYNALQYAAVHTSTPLNVTLIAASMPLFMLVVGALFFGSPPRRPQLVGAAFSLVGVALVISRGQIRTLLDIALLPGDLLMLLATALWALYSWMLAAPPASMRGEQRPAWTWSEFLLVQIVFGGLWAALGAAGEATIAPQPLHWSPGVVAALLYVAIGPSLIAYRCWGLGVSTVGPAVAAFFSNLTPVFAGVLQASLLGEPPRWYHAVAFALIVAGIVVSQAGVRAAQKVPG
jgi:drug/metabolite transporter (DMT)-like permease